MQAEKPTRLIVGITGATGTIFGVRLLQMLHVSGVETHLVVSKWAARTLTHETPHSLKYVQSLATQSYGIKGIPTLILFREGKEVERVVGATSKESITRMIEKYITAAA